jgi:hypothetical protein
MRLITMPSCVPISDANLCIHIPTVDCTHGCGGNIDPSATVSGLSPQSFALAVCRRAEADRGKVVDWENEQEISNREL